MLWFGTGKIAYKWTNLSSRYTNRTFQLKSPNRPGEFFLSIDHSRTVHNVQSSSTLFMGISDHIAHVWRKIGLSEEYRIWRLFQCNKMPLTNRITWFTPYVRIVKWNYHGTNVLHFKYCMIKKYSLIFFVLYVQEVLFKLLSTVCPRSPV